MTGSNLDVITKDNDIYAKLIVPTKSDGATVSQSGTKVGGDNFSATSSYGNVEEKSYKDYVSRFSIENGAIIVGVMLNEGWNDGQIGAKKGKKPNRTIRISLRDVTDVRQEEVKKYPGIVFETPSDVYQLKVATNEGGGLLGKEFDTAILKKAVSTIEGQMGDSCLQREDDSDKEISRSEQQGSVVEELQKLSELHEKGALSEEEFQVAKDKLL